MSQDQCEVNITRQGLGCEKSDSEKRDFIGRDHQVKPYTAVTTCATRVFNVQVRVHDLCGCVCVQ